MPIIDLCICHWTVQKVSKTGFLWQSFLRDKISLYIATEYLSSASNLAPTGKYCTTVLSMRCYS